MRLDPQQRAKHLLAIFIVWTMFAAGFVVAVAALGGGIREVFSGGGDSLILELIAASPLLPLALWLWTRKQARDQARR